MTRLLAALALLAFSGLALAQQQPVNCATSTPCSNGGPVNTGTGDQPPIAFSKLNANDTQLYGMFGNGSSLQTTGKASAADVIGLWSGTCSASAYLNGAGVCETPPQGTVTSVGIAPAGTYAAAISVSGSPVTSSGVIDITPNLFSSSAAGVVPSSGGGTSNYLRADGTWAAPPGTTGCSFEAPTAEIGLTAVIGSTGKCMDAGSAPALDQSISPTWTGTHTFDHTIQLESAEAFTATSVVGTPSWSSFQVGQFYGGSIASYTGAGSGTADIRLDAGAYYNGSSWVCLGTASAMEIDVGSTGPTPSFWYTTGCTAGTLFSPTEHFLGYLGTPINIQPNSYTFQLSDIGKTIEAGYEFTYTVPSGVFAAGDVITLLAPYNAGYSTLAAGSGLTMYWANGTTNSTGNRTITGAGIATIIFVSGTVCYVTGSGISSLIEPASLAEAHDPEYRYAA